jgi:hypothetical protein
MLLLPVLQSSKGVLASLGARDLDEGVRRDAPPTRPSRQCGRSIALVG